MKGHVSRYIIVGIILILTSGICLHAQRSLIRTYTVGDGLVMNKVRGFHQDKEGFIWMYTWDGLSRYEGYRFRNYIAGRDLQHSFVNDIFELPDGTLYLPLNDGATAVMRNQKIQPDVLMPGAIINNFCRDDEGRIYAATDDTGIRQFENGKLLPGSSSSPTLSIQQIVFYQNHFFFIGPYAGPSGVYDREMNMVAAWQGPTAFFNSIYKDHRNRIFVCTLEGLKEVDLSTSTFNLMDASILPYDAPWKNWNANSVIVTPETDTWIGTNQGLVHLRPDQSWSVLTIQDGLLSNRINSLFLDKSNTLWIGTDAGVASIILQSKILDNRNVPGVFSNYILPVRDGSIYAITGDSWLNQFDTHLNTLRSGFIGNTANTPLGLIPRETNMLLVRGSTIEQLNADVFPFQKPDKATAGVLYAKIENNYWLATDYSIYCTQFPGTRQRFLDSSFYVTTIANARNNQLLIGTLQNGVFLGRTQNNANGCHFEIVKDLSKWTDDPRVRSLMTSSNGDIWIGTRYSGVFRLQCDEDYSNCTKQAYSISDGLVSNWITSMAEDQYGNIWVGSASGIDKLIPRDNTYFVFSFSRVTGYYSNVRHLVMHPDGSLWAGHSEGISRIIDGHIDTIGPQPTYITEASLGGDNYPTVEGTTVILRYHENSAHFAFAAPDFINSSQLKFTYRLLGSKDTTWSQPVKTHEIFYGNLRPGKFRFEVASYGWNGERSDPTSYSFQVLKPYWNQSWFIALCILAISLGVFGLYRFRISQIQHVQSVRDRIAADLHDDIASTLTHINILSEIGKQQRPGNGGSDLFERIGSEVQTSSEALDDIIWSVRRRRDAIGDVLARMRQYATEIFEPAGIHLQIKENVDGIQSLEMEFKRDFYLVYKELLRNILTHAHATHVDIDINVNRTRVAIQISDNGKGFDIDLPTQRSGVSNIKARVKKWNGTVTWNSGLDKGTHVIVEMKPA